ncbi:MAG: hypothetical protein V7750_00535 [Sneathiella sp.]
MENSLLKEAIVNNAQWCMRVWQSHDLESEKYEGLVYCPSEVPDFYPNIITTQQGANKNERLISDLTVQNSSQNLSIKDSFAELDLASLNFKKLFDAHWLRFSNQLQNLQQPNLSWRAVKSEQELENWERHWDEREGEVSRIFTDSLLKDPTVKFWSGYSIDNIQAGYISNATGNVVGISNTFGSYKDCIHHAKTQFQHQPIVGYETGSSLEEAKDIDAEIIGDLTIWI